MAQKRSNVNIKDLDHLGPLVRKLDEEYAKKSSGLWGVNKKAKKEPRIPRFSDPVRHSPINPAKVRSDINQSEQDWKDIKEGLVTRMMARRMDPELMAKVDPMPEGHMALKRGLPKPRTFARKQILKPRHLEAFNPPESKPDLFIDHDPMTEVPAPAAMDVAQSDDPSSYPESADNYSDMVLELAKKKVAEVLSQIQMKEPEDLSLEEVGNDDPIMDAKSRLTENRKALDLIALPGIDENAEIKGLNDEGMLEDPEVMSPEAAAKGRNFEGRSGYTPFQRNLGQTRDKYPTAKGGPTKSLRISGIREKGLTSAADVRKMPVNERTAFLQQLAEGGWSEEMKRLIETIQSDKALLGPEARETGEPYPAYLEDLELKAAKEKQLEEDAAMEMEPVGEGSKTMQQGREGSVIPRMFREGSNEKYVPSAGNLPKRPKDARKQEIFTQVMANKEDEKRLPFNKRGKSDKVYKSATRYPKSEFGNTKAFIRKLEVEGEKKPAHSRVSIPARLTSDKKATAQDALAKVLPRAHSMASRGFMEPLGVSPRVSELVGPRVNLDALRAILGIDDEEPGRIKEGVSAYKIKQAEMAKKRRATKKTLENEG